MKGGDTLDRARALLLDFDGPVCSVFAGLPAATISDQLRHVLADGGHATLPDAVATSDDPFDVFRYASTVGDSEAHYVEAALAAHEVEAITTAVPTPGAHDLIKAWRGAGRPVAIVSNNGIQAVSAYLDLHDLRSSVAVLSARESSNAALLKPNPFLVCQAISALGVATNDAVLIGDSTTDVEAAQAAGVRSIGYANKPGKHSDLAASGADAIIETIDGLTKGYA